MAPRANHKPIEAEGQAIIQELHQERLRLAIQYTLVTVLEEEVEIFIQAALYQRTPERKGYRNGFYASERQRCLKHKIENVLAYVPKKHHEQVRPELKAIIYQENREKAGQALAAFLEKYADIYPSAIECLKRDLEACLTFYRFPQQHWRYLCTTNIIERLFAEVKKRSHKMAAAFRNENSCMLMFYAVIRSLKLRRITVTTQEIGFPNVHNS